MLFSLQKSTYSKAEGEKNLNLYKAQTSDSGAIFIGLILLIILIIGIFTIRKK